MLITFGWYRVDLRSFAVWMIPILLTAALGIATGRPGFVVAAGLGAVLACVAVEQPTVFISVAVLSTFLSRFSFDVFGLRLRLEVVVGVFAFAALLAGVRTYARRSRLPAPLVIALTWLLWVAAVSVLNSPDLKSSAVIVFWLLTDFAIVVYIYLFAQDLRRIITVGVWCAFVSAIAGVLLWAAATFGGSRFWVQIDPAYGGYAAYGTVFEANILASIVCLWAIVGMSNAASGVPAWVRGGLVALTPLIALATHTRIALGVSALILLVAFVRSPGARTWISVGSVGAVLIWQSFDPEELGLSKFTGGISLSEGTGRYRAVSWQQALADLHSGDPMTWVYGLGLNSFGQRHLDPSLPGTGARWYLGNLPLQIIYDGGIVAVAILGLAFLWLVMTRISFLSLVFLLCFVLFAVSTSTLWLLQTWIFFGIGLSWANVRSETASERLPI